MTGIIQPRLAAQVVLQDSAFCVATWHQTVFTVFSGIATVEHVVGISALCQSFLSNGKGPATYMSVIERSSPAPTDVVRKELARWSRDVASKMSAAVIVAEGGGFKNAIVRGVGVALTVLTPHAVPFKFCGNVAEGVELLARFIPESVGGAAELSLAIAEVRARYTSHV